MLMHHKHDQLFKHLTSLPLPGCFASLHMRRSHCHTSRCHLAAAPSVCTRDSASGSFLLCRWEGTIHNRTVSCSSKGPGPGQSFLGTPCQSGFILSHGDTSQLPAGTRRGILERMIVAVEPSLLLAVPRLTTAKSTDPKCPWSAPGCWHSTNGGFPLCPSPCGLVCISVEGCRGLLKQRPSPSPRTSPFPGRVKDSVCSIPEVLKALCAQQSLPTRRKPPGQSRNLSEFTLVESLQGKDRLPPSPIPTMEWEEGSGH